MKPSKRVCEKRALYVLVCATMAADSIAATINVPDDQPTIQAGINAATSGVDEVVVAPGIYDELINLNGKAITVRSSGGAALTTLDATLAVNPGDGKPVVRCDSGEGAATIIEGFTITGGTGDTVKFGGTQVGGGMFIDNSYPSGEPRGSGLGQNCWRGMKIAWGGVSSLGCWRGSSGRGGMGRVG